MLMIGGQCLELTHTWTCQNMRGWLTGGAIGGKEGCTDIGLHLKSTEGPRCMYASQVLDMDPSDGRRAQVTLRDKVIPPIPPEGVRMEPLRIGAVLGKCHTRNQNKRVPWRRSLIWRWPLGGGYVMRLEPSCPGLVPLEKRPRELALCPLLLGEGTVRRQPTMNKEAVPHQTPDLLAPSSWNPSLQNCEK